MRILIVDSSAPIIERLEEIIAEAEHLTAIHSAVFYEEAKKLCKQNKYDAVLLDIDLPGNESLKLVKEIRKSGRRPCIIILFTHLDNYIREQFKLLDVIFFFDKYYDFEKIGGLLEKLSFTNTKGDLGEKRQMNP